MNHIAGLTSLRIFFAIWVIVFHYADFLQHIPVLKDVRYFGFFGVSFFFILSGCVLTFSSLNKPFDAKRFRVARLARIYPLYVVSLLMLLLAVPLQGNPDVWSHVLRYLLMVQAWGSEWALAINFPGWSIACEMFFYMLFPFIFTRIRSLSTPQVLTVSVGLYAAILSLGFFNGPVQPSPYNPLLHLPQFILGCLVGLLLHRKAFVQQVSRWGWLAFPAMALVVYPGQAFGLSYLVLNCGFLAPLLALGILHVAYTNRLQHPGLVLLGNASYAVYILQEPVVQMFLKVFQIQTKMTASWFGLYVLILIVVSIVVHVSVELKLQKKLLRHFQPLPAPVS